MTYALHILWRSRYMAFSYQAVSHFFFQTHPVRHVYHISRWSSFAKRYYFPLDTPCRYPRKFVLLVRYARQVSPRTH